MQIAFETRREEEKIARLVDTAKHFPLSIQEWLQYQWDLETDEVVPLYVEDAISWATALWDRASQVVYEDADQRRAHQKAALSSVEAAQQNQS